MDFSGTSVTPGQAALFERHWRLICDGNTRTNLTAAADEETAAWRHYRDSLMGLDFLPGGPIVDFGSGAGFPGLVIAIVRPEWEVCLVEPRRKRAEFLELAVRTLELSNVQVLQAKMTSAPPQRYAHAVTRATFSDSRRFVDAAPWLQPGGTLVAWRAADAIASEWELERKEYILTGDSAQRLRCLAVYRFAEGEPATKA
jgi:16S rRNA (guanine527-N7)-methyltransferase